MSSTNQDMPQPLSTLIDSVVCRPSTEYAQPTPPPRLPDKLLERLWMKMAEMFGHRWTSSFGEKADPSGAWASALRGLDGRQLANGLNAVAMSGEEWPPSAPAFRVMCLRPCLNTLGLPSVDEAFRQALSGFLRNEVVRAAAKATGTFELRQGTTGDVALRRAFEANYLLMARRYRDGAPLNVAAPILLGHDSQKTVLELADEHAEQHLQSRIAQQGIPSGLAAREQLLASLRNRRGGQAHV